MKAFKNYLYVLAYQILSILLPLVTVPYISSTLGAVGIGKYSYTYANSQYFVVFGMIGLSLYGNRQIAYIRDDKKKLKETFFSIYTLQLITTSTSLLIYLIYTFMFNEGEYRMLYLAQGISVAAAMLDISWLFMALEDFKKTVVRNTIVKLISLASIFIFIKSESDLMLYTIIISFSMFLGNLSLWLYVPKEVGFKDIKIKNVHKHFKDSVALFIPQVAVQIYSILDKTLLGVMTDTVEVGYYENTQKLYRVAIIIATGVATVMMPKISNVIAEGNMEKVKDYVKKSFFFVTLISVPLTLGLIGISKELAPWFFTSEFEGIEKLVMVYSFAIFLVGWSNVLRTELLVPMNKTKEFTISVTVGAIANLILNIIFLREFKAIGACYTTLVAELIVTVLQFWYVRDVLKAMELIKPTLIFIPSGIFMFFAVRGIGNAMGSGIVTNVVQVAVGALVYVIIVIILYRLSRKRNFIKDCVAMLKEE